MRIIILVLLCWLSVKANAACYPISADTHIVGKLQFSVVKAGDNFTQLAQKYDVGYDQLQAANPRLDSVHPLVHAAVIIPSQYMLPNVARKGIVVNVAQMRLFYYPPGTDRVCTYPVGIGKQNWQTPTGVLHIAQKIPDPIWIVPDSIMRYRQKNGDPVAKIVQSGPDNPLGYYAMRLSLPTYLIHGTDDPSSVGRRSSAGCIHLFAADIAQLFAMTALKTPVRIINQPYQITWQGRSLYFIASPPLIEMQQKFDADNSSQQQYLYKIASSQIKYPELATVLPQLQQAIAHPVGMVRQVVF